MIDIHTHILPGVDDGSESLEMSMEMIRMAADSGTSVIVATPHNYLPGLIQDLKELRSRFYELSEKIQEEQIDIKLVSGMEIFATWEMPELLSKGQVWTLNRTKYFLTEFDFEEDPFFCTRVLERCKKRGFLPVIAHPERYEFVQRSPVIVYEWICEGYGIQINKGSLLGRFGSGPKHTAEILMGCGLVSCIASDAHSPWSRTPHMTEIRELLEDEYGTDYTRMVLEENPRRILQGKELVGYEPIYPY
ncbi:MAG: hypothetical protein MR543_09855 [Robinsoniella sp.]|nr:hypothetical protein [Robinsoniella sp.]